MPTIDLNFFIKKAKFWAKILTKLPGVDAIFLSGSLAQAKYSANSDIDFFIITKSNKIWTARFFTYIILKTFRVIATEKNHSKNICPNHFISQNSLEIIEKDAYSANLFSHNQFLAGNQQTWFKFVKINQSWVTKFNESFSQKDLQDSKKMLKSHPETKNKVLKIPRKTSLLENILKQIQLKKIKKNPDYHKKHAKIILTDTELRFHPNPRNINWKKQSK